MTKRDHLDRVAAPGLPPWPKLYYSPRTRRATVDARHPTWRSQERARQAAFALTLLVIAGILWWFWGRLPELDLPSKLLVSGAFFAVLGPFVAVLLSATLPGFLARRVFCTRTTFWFTPEAVAFRSHFYRRPVVVWRHWKEKPVAIRLIALPSSSARDFRSSLSFEKQMKRGYLEHAQTIQMVLGMDHQRGEYGGEGHNASLRALNVTDIGPERAEKLTTVLSAALALTAKRRGAKVGRAAKGVDIDKT